MQGSTKMLSDIFTLRNNFWRETLMQFTFARDFACTVTLLHMSHVTANLVAVSPSECTYFQPWMLALCGVSMLLYLISCFQRSGGAWSVIADVVGVPVGVALQVTSKPSGWFLSVPTAGCDLMSQNTAEFAFATGELMTFPVAARVVLWVFSRVTNTLARIAAVGGLASASVLVAFGLNLVL
jgi:hypothetical protein